MTPGNQLAWHGLFTDHDFEFRFGARLGDAVVFSADTSEHDRLMTGRRAALENAPAQCLIDESTAAPVAEWAGLARPLVANGHCIGSRDF